MVDVHPRNKLATLRIMQDFVPLQHPAGLYVWLSSPFHSITAALCVLANTIAHVAELTITRQTKAAVKGALVLEQLLKVPKSSEAGQVPDCSFCERLHGRTAHVWCNRLSNQISLVHTHWHPSPISLSIDIVACCSNAGVCICKMLEEVYVHTAGLCWAVLDGTG